MSVRRMSSARIAAVCLGLLATAALSGLVPPASAQGFFDFFFGGAPQRQPPSRLRPQPYSYAPQTSSYAPEPGSYADSVFAPRREPARRRPRHLREVEESDEPTAAGAFCVRLCDGRYFPIQRGAASAAETCKSFCPASKTKVFSGDEIDDATASDGTRYADLANAFVYRTKMLADCTCNGKDPTGVTRLDVKADPTLRPGDVVATTDGLLVYQGGETRKATRNFTPVASSNLPADVRRQLLHLKVGPPSTTIASTGAPAQTAATAKSDDTQRAQLDR